jgi:hypothetical protein
MMLIAFLFRTRTMAKKATRDHAAGITAKALSAFVKSQGNAPLMGGNVKGMHVAAMPNPPDAENC